MSGWVFAILTVGVGLLGAAGTRLIRAVSFFGSAVAGEVTVGICNGTAMGLTTGGGRDGGEKEVGGGTLFFGGGGNEGSGGESRSGMAALADGATSGGGRNGLDGGGAVEELAVWLTVRPGAVGKSLELAEGASVQPHPVLRGNQAQAAGRVA